MTDIPPDTALKIARWCWPKRTWADANDFEGDAIVYSAEPNAWCWDANERSDIHTAELVLIERGLEEEYGRAILFEMWGDCDDYSDAAGVNSYSIVYSQAAHLVTAPLDVRARAMLAVIEKHTGGASPSADKETTNG